jgi:N utilization substance protein A
VQALLATEVPEVADRTVQLRAVARAPGRRTKLAVLALDPTVDPVTACVGPNARHVHAIQAALVGERIDLVPWSEDPERMVALALAPARVQSVELDGTLRRAIVHVSRDQLDVARGVDGLNQTLAGELTGWSIELVPDAI